MEVTAATYPYDVLGLLVNISEAEFVSFDLELSGIPSRLPGKDAWKPRGGGKKSLEDRYQETREAANRYQILQVGITCGRFDYVANEYVLRPYNITISPLLEERLDIEREVSIQSGAASFLMNNGFDLGAPFTKGVQYLSREEAQRAKQMAWDRLEGRNAIADVVLKEEEKDSIDFVKRAREAIAEWQVASRLGALEITTHTGLTDPPQVPVISRFEKRLVHQLVRADFPDLVSIGRNECIRIVPKNPLREADNTRRLKLRTEESIARQTGFRWVFEALANGDISEMDPFQSNSSVCGSIIAVRCHDDKDRFDRAHERLRKHQPVLVGHNMFTDVVYFYRTFVGELPETLDGFCEALHKEFPRIIDTKWLATHAEGDLNASPSLQEIAESMEDQLLPEIITHHEHPKYNNVMAFHEAGFDSLLTATIMLRISAKVNAELQEKNKDVVSDNSSDESFKSAVAEQDVDDAESLATKKRSRRRKHGKNTANKSAPSARFETKNMFEKLRLISESEQDNASSSDDDKKAKDPVPSVSSSWQNDTYSPDKTKWVPIQTIKRKPMELIPAFDSKFWDEFGNTLRVFGSDEGVLKIAGWEKQDSLF